MHAGWIGHLFIQSQKEMAAEIRKLPAVLFFVACAIFVPQGNGRNLLDPTLIGRELQSFSNDALAVDDLQVRLHLYWFKVWLIFNYWNIQWSVSCQVYYTWWLHIIKVKLNSISQLTKLITRANLKRWVYVGSSLDINFATYEKGSSRLIPLCGFRVSV